MLRCRLGHCFVRSGNPFPSSSLRGLENCVRDLIGRQSIAESRRSQLTASYTLEKVRDLMNKRVLISDLQARDPPVLHVRMIGIRDMYASPPANLTFVTVIEVLNAV